MKFALNGALTIGTWDGATIEMAEAMGPENVFLFGHRAEGIENMRELGYLPRWIAQQNPRLGKVLDALAGGEFSPGEPARYKALVESLLQSDRYFLLADFADYLAAQQRVDALYADQRQWQAAVVRNIAGMGRFSTDRTIAEYVARVWSADSLPARTAR
jgi:starch phosphorylase